MANLLWALYALLGRCKHRSQIFTGSGAIERGGSSLAAGAVTGQWHEKFCLDCHCTRVDRELY